MNKAAETNGISVNYHRSPEASFRRPGTAQSPLAITPDHSADQQHAYQILNGLCVNVHITLKYRPASLTPLIDRCEQCGGAVKIIASIEDPEVIGRILEHLPRSEVANPPLPPARAPPLRAADLFD